VHVPTVNNKMQPLPTLSTRERLDSGPVVRRPVYSVELGRFFLGLRAQKGWDQSTAARFARQRQIPLTRNTLVRLEAGGIKHPEPHVLTAVSRLYGIDYETAVAAYVSCVYGNQPAPSVEVSREDVAAEAWRLLPGTHLRALARLLTPLEDSLVAPLVAVAEALIASLRVWQTHAPGIESAGGPVREARTKPAPSRRR
jgi:transcriptional regulator with XRE-family HTH domain